MVQIFACSFHWKISTNFWSIQLVDRFFLLHPKFLKGLYNSYWWFGTRWFHDLFLLRIVSVERTSFDVCRSNASQTFSFNFNDSVDFRHFDILLEPKKRIFSRSQCWKIIQVTTFKPTEFKLVLIFLHRESEALLEKRTVIYCDCKV